MQQLTTEASAVMRDQLTDAMTAYYRHSTSAASLLDSDDLVERADAATHAQLANAAAVMAQAMAALLAADQD